jgi:hypothetical protein
LSDEPRAGEWATVVHEHCPPCGIVGAVVKVIEIEPPHPEMYLRCLVCDGTYSHGEPHALLPEHNRNGSPAYVPLRWLKRLPPQDEVIAHDRRELERAVDDQERRLQEYATKAINSLSR